MFARGLTSEEVQTRVREGKVNGDQNVKTKSIAEIIRTNTISFFNVLFVSLAILMLFFVPKDLSGLSNLGFVGVVFINVLIGIIQEIRAKKTIDQLSLISAPKVRAVRDEEEVEIALKDIVLDEVILLSAGNQICADSVVIDGKVEVNESQITGEPDAVPKTEGEEVLSGSYVVSGNAIVRVTRVGTDNYAAKISAGAKYIKKPNSEILISLTRFIRLMAFLIVPLGLALVLVKYFAQHNELNSTVVTVIGTMVGMIPSGLVALTSAVFCVSIVRLSQHKTLAQDLYCTETLARVNTLCLDKTGTLTEGIMEVRRLETQMGQQDFKQILKNLVAATGDENPTANAIRDFTADMDVDLSPIDIIPFSSIRKWSGANFEGRAYAMGAAEFMFPEPPSEVLSAVGKLSEEGRVITVTISDPIVEEKLPEQILVLGYVIISDKIRQEAPDTLKFFADQGVDLKIISGDNPLTVKTIAERCGFPNADSYVDLSTLRDEESVRYAATKYSIFGRVTPDQKLLLVKSLKAAGRTVAMTGDGVNDVLALREADCSIAMASGSDAAKNVSQLVLLDSNFASMPRVVSEGRRSINNLQRSASLYLVKTVYNLLFSIIFLILSADLPFEPKHLTLIGGITIGIPSFILALEPNNDLIKGSFIDKVVLRAVPAGLTVTICVVAATLGARLTPLNAEQVSTVSLIITTFIGFLFLIRICIPFNKVRLILVLGLAGAFIASFFADFGFFSFPVFFGLTGDWAIEMLYLIAPLCGAAVVIFLLLDWVFKRFDDANFVSKFLVRVEEWTTITSWKNFFAKQAKK